MLDWNDLKFVLAIAEAGTLSGATRMMDASQPTISRRLKQLEKTLGLKLFERGLDGYRLTSAGKRVHACALQMEFEARKIEYAIADDTALEGNIIVTASAGLASYFVTPLLARFHADFPRITHEMIVTYDTVDVSRRVADIAVRVGDHHVGELERWCVGQTYFSIFGSADYLEKNGEPKRLDDLKHHIIIGSSGGIANFMQTKLLLDMSKGASVTFTTDNLMNQLAAVKAGFGLMVLPTYMAIEAPELRQVLVDEFYPSLDVWILTHKDLIQIERIRALTDFLVDGIGEKLKEFTKP